jgi:NtrC-family two-component system sensor histidine kinase KinB
MKIKTRLNLGIGSLFVLITFLAVISAMKINDLRTQTENILVANYNTLEYTRNILSALDDTTLSRYEIFEENLKKQEENITEYGEFESTMDLRSLYEKYKAGQHDKPMLIAIRAQIYKIMELNMLAIQRKSDLAKQTAFNTNFWIAGTGTLCFLIAFILLLNLPSSIANPIKELTESIKEIAAGNYKERVHFESRSEFGELAESFNTMAEKLEEFNHSSLAKIMVEKKRIETLINNMHDPVIGLDENLKVIFANEQATKIMGLQSTPTFGDFAPNLTFKNELMRHLVKDLTEPLMVNAMKKNEPLKIYADGKESYFEKEILHISILPTGEKNEVLIGHVIILRNVTEYKELDSAKTNFIANISHEFKTPISSIKMSLQLLENEHTGKLNKEQHKLMESIKEDADRLLKITTELLNMTQVESGNIQLNIMPSNPVDILNYAVNTVKTQAEQKKIKLEISYPDKLPRVMADSEKTAWVLTNLMSNAIRYSFLNSRILIRINEDKEKLTFEVKDTGQGIDPQYKDKIFDRYFRIPGSQKEGTGLGLAISKEFIEAEGGQISMASEIGEGSTFWVTLNSCV